MIVAQYDDLSVLEEVLSRTSSRPVFSKRVTSEKASSASSEEIVSTSETTTKDIEETTSTTTTTTDASTESSTEKPSTAAIGWFLFQITLV